MDRQQPARELGYGYALGGRIMLSAIIVLFVIVVFMSALHLYARWYFLRLRRRRTRHRGIVFHADHNHHHPTNQGLDQEVLNSLPFYPFCSSTADPSVVDCSVCLAEFQDKEVVRSLPKCGHSFHIQCIDMWLYSHSSCPLCRSPVQVDQPPATTPPMVEPEQASVGNSGQQHSSSDSEARHGPSTSTDAPSSSESRKVASEFPLRLRIDVAPPTLPETGLESPGSRFLQFKRLLSFNKRLSPGGTCGSPRTFTSEVDLEAGRVPQTPR